MRRVLALWFVLSCLLMGAASLVDQEWTRWAQLNAWTGFARFMRQSLFETGRFGGGDIATLMTIACLLIYLCIAIPTAPPRASFAYRWRASRPALGFIVISVVTVGLACVHPIKFLMARARPNINAIADFTPFYQLPAMVMQWGDVRWSRGSFPSGHTATAFSLMALVYASLFFWQRGVRYQRGTLAAGCLVVLFAASMALARMMGFAHWLSDTLASVLLSWGVMHTFYFYLLRVPQQEIWLQQHSGSYPTNLPSLWELRLLGAILLAAYALVLTGLVWRFSTVSIWLCVVVSLLGLFICFACGRYAQRLHQRLVYSFQSEGFTA